MIFSFLLGVNNKVGINSKFERLVEDDLLEILVNHESSILLLTWKQHPNSEQFKEGYRAGIDLTFKHGLKFWLSDSRKVNYVEAADQLWLVMKLRPILKSGKLNKFACVMNFSNYSMTDTSLIYEDPEREIEENSVKFHILFDMESAFYWLMQDEDYLLGL